MTFTFGTEGEFKLIWLKLKMSLNVVLINLFFCSVSLYICMQNNISSLHGWVSIFSCSWVTNFQNFCGLIDWLIWVLVLINILWCVVQVGGLEEAYVAAKPLFLSMGKSTIYCGGAGNGSVRVSISLDTAIKPSKSKSFVLIA